MMRRWGHSAIFVLAAVWLVLWKPSSALAQVASAQDSLSVCSRLPDQLGPQDVDWIQSRLGEIFPVRYATILAKIRIKVDDSDSIAGPEKRGTELFLPPAFLKRLCHQVLLQAEFASRFGGETPMDETERRDGLDEANRIVAQNMACQADGGTAPKCLDEAILHELRGRGLPQRDDDEESEAERIIAFAYGAAEFLIAHEAAHLIMEESLSAAEFGKLTPLNEEVEADLYAQQHLFGQQKLPLGPMMAMATMSMAGLEESAAARSHPTAICRYRQFRSLFEKSAPTYFKVVEFFSKSMDSDDENQIADMVQEIMDTPMLTAGSAAPDCGSDANPYVAAAISEIDGFFDPLLAKLNAADVGKFSDIADDGDLISPESRKKIAVAVDQALVQYRGRKWKSKASKKLVGQRLVLLSMMSTMLGLYSELDMDKYDDDDQMMRDMVRKGSPALKSAMRLAREIGAENFSREDKILSDYGEQALGLVSKIVNDKRNYKIYYKKNNDTVDQIFSKYNFNIINYFKRQEYFRNLSPSLSTIYFPNSEAFVQIAQSYSQGQLLSGNCASQSFRDSVLIARIWKTQPNAQVFDQYECEGMLDEIKPDDWEET